MIWGPSWDFGLWPEAGAGSTAGGTSQAGSRRKYKNNGHNVEISVTRDDRLGTTTMLSTAP